eukprot:Pgem_evm1s5713
MTCTREYTEQEMQFIEECKTIKESIDENDLAALNNFVESKPHTAHQRGIMIETSSEEIMMATLEIIKMTSEQDVVADIEEVLREKFLYRKGLTPLMYAAVCGVGEIVQDLVITRGVQVGVINCGMTALDYCIKLCTDESKRNEIVCFLLNHGGVQYLEKALPSLCLACTIDTPSIEVLVEILLKYGANPNSRAVVLEDYTPLMLAINHEISSLAIKCLVNNGADVNLGTADYMTPLAVAAQNAHISTVSYLLMYGASYTSGKSGDPFIHPAGRCNLLTETAVRQCIHSYTQVALKRVPEMDIISSISFVYYILLAAIQTRDGTTVNMCLVILRSIVELGGEQVNITLDTIFDMPSPTPCRLPYTPVQVACLHGYDDMLTLLLASVPVDINLRNTENETAMDMAMKFRHFKCVELLRQHQNINIKPPSYTLSEQFPAQHQHQLQSQSQLSSQSQVPLLQQPRQMVQQQQQQQQQVQQQPQSQQQPQQLQNYPTQSQLRHHPTQSQLRNHPTHSRQPTKLALGREEVMARCSHCGNLEQTEVRNRTGLGTITMCFVMSLCLLCCVPFCGGSFKDKVHKCRKCKREIGRSTF